MPIMKDAGREYSQLRLWRDAGLQRLNSGFGDGKPFVFVEGPPTTNDKPAIHHVAADAVKDHYPRYKTMHGYTVLRSARLDTDGLPSEVVRWGQVPLVAALSLD